MDTDMQEKKIKVEMPESMAVFLFRLFNWSTHSRNELEKTTQYRYAMGETVDRAIIGDEAAKIKVDPNQLPFRSALLAAGIDRPNDWSNVDPPLIRIGERVVEINPDGSLQVGCTYVPSDIVDEIIKRRNTK